MGKKKFNMESKKGIQFLISHHLVAETPEEVAQFLYKEEGLNKTAIGDYLGEKNEFNEAVLKVFYLNNYFVKYFLSRRSWSCTTSRT